MDDYADGSRGPDHFRVAIYDLRRTGAYVTLDFGIRCVSTSCSTQFDFGPPPPGGEENAPDGTTLVDPIGNKRYFPVRDAQGHADVSALPPAISDHVMHVAYATFPAPPVSVSRLDVLFSFGGPQISGMAITAATPPAAADAGAGAVSASAAPFSASGGGLRLPVRNLQLTIGNLSGSDTESQGETTISLRSDVLFHFGRSTLTSRARTILHSAAATIRARARGVVQVTGYTDSKGTDAINVPLSQARAASVAAVLKPATAGAPISLQATGDGASNPVAPNTHADGSDDPVGRALNRRVTIAFHAKTAARPAPPPPPPPPPPGAANATRTLTYRSQTGAQDVSIYPVTVQRIFRSGDLAVLQLTLHCSSATTQGNPSGTCHSQFDFAGTPTAPPPR